MPGAWFERFGATLWRWTTPHPLWTPKEADHTGGWPRDVGSVVFVRDGTATIFDPQAAEDDDELWAVLAERTADAGRIVVALTASWHLRSSVAVLDRLGGEIRLHRQAAGDTVMRGLGRVRPFVADGEVAPGVEALLIGGLINGEVLYWLPEHGAFVAGEVFHGRPDGLRIAPDPQRALGRRALRVAARARPPARHARPADARPAGGRRAGGGPRRDRAPAVEAVRLRMSPT
jgi:hypothetical protein